MKKFYVLFSLLIALFLSSCGSRKDFVYLNDMHVGEKYMYDTKIESSVRVGDRLGITVSCKNPELAIPFNIQGGNFQVDNSGNVNSVLSQNEKGYLVDVEGNIDFPILGKLHVAGLTMNEIKVMITDNIVNNNYIKDPLVQVELLNFKYTVLGAVARNGSFTSSGNRITLLEAIANAGDLTSKAKIDRVTVIREVNGARQMFVHDLRSKDIFDSPCFYLQQNDVVYVEPKYKKKDTEDRGWQISTFILSIVTAACSLMWALK